MSAPSSYYDPQLLLQIAEGDEAAFAGLYAAYYPRLKAYALKFTRSSEDAEEMLQESFLQVWLHRERLPDIEYLQAWIYKIMARSCLQWLRKKNTEAIRMQQLAPTAATTPAEWMQWSELEKNIRQAIAGLSAIRQQIYRLNREEGWKPSQIAAQLNMPVGTVKNHLHIAVKTIREQLIQEGYPLEMLILVSLSANFF